LRDGVIVHAPDPTSPKVARLPDAGVEATRTAKVTLRDDGEFLLTNQPFSRSVRTAIVYDNDPTNLMRLLLDCLDAFLQQRQTIMSYYDRINFVW
jgi:hypothetical protein